MVIDNKIATTRMAWLIIFAIIMSAFSLVMCMLFRIDKIVVYVIISSSLIIQAFILFTMKYFKLEISEEHISIKYSDPLLNRYNSACMELPWYKVSSCQLKKSMFSHYIRIGIFGKRGDKILHYNLGILSKSNIHYIENNLRNVQFKTITYNINNEFLYYNE
jgi:hypothetical protein